MAGNYTPIPDDFLEEMEELSDAEYGRLIRWCQKYHISGEMEELRGNEKFYAKRVKMQIDRFDERYEEVVERRRAAGKAGGLAKASKAKQTLAKASKSSQTQTQTQTQTNSPDGESARARRFTPPTVEEVAAYVAERGSNVDPQGFIDFYASKGWLVGKTPMKDWKAACRNAEHWERWEHKPAGKPDSRAPTAEDVKMLSQLDRLRARMKENGG